MEKKTFGKFCWIVILALALNAIETNILRAQVSEEGASVTSQQNETEKITVGVVEDVILNPWGVSFAARIDTGADLSSLDARDLVVRNNVAEFTLGKRWGGRRLQLPVVEWTKVQTAMGTEKRPIVEISICLGSKHFNTLATLKDRSEMLYPFLIGRSALKGNYLVDASLSRAARPICPLHGAKSKDFVATSKE
ncbi:MAG TPA: RimK/LysX family protein [Acidobacteriota bacterium]|nr:RimK/LysX family protein [Acidobacteriota bacterium]